MKVKPRVHTNLGLCLSLIMEVISSCIRARDDPIAALVIYFKGQRTLCATSEKSSVLYSCSDGPLLRVQEPIATELEEIRNYHPAEDYHQKYLARGGRFGNPQNPQKGCTDPIRCYG